MMHWHVCPCGHEWQHGGVPTEGKTEEEVSAEHDRMHTCTNCGTYVNQVACDGPIIEVEYIPHAGRALDAVRRARRNRL